MKFKHNKKRNTAFLFESLVRELTRNSIKGSQERKDKILNIIKEFFNKRTVLYAELQLFKTLYENADLDFKTAEKVLNEAKKRHKTLSKKDIFNAQTKLINKINKALGKDIFENFVPNYKQCATIYQVLYENVNIKDQIKLEEKIINHLQKSADVIKEQKYKPISRLAFNKFYNKFNEVYGSNLLKEQKELINHYVTSFENDDLEFKIFLNEEIGRLKSNLKKATIDQKESILEVLNSFANKGIDGTTLEKVLKIQQLVKEIKNNGN